MHSFVFYLAVMWLAALLGVIAFEVVRARSTAVRILAADTLTLVLIALLVLASHAVRSPYYLDAALALALLSFVATLAVGRYWGLGRPF
jgi:multicomponent Na+:H+ antiporter subunit F